MVRIRTKLVAAILAISVFFELMIIMSYIASLSVSDSFDEISDQSVPQINALQQMKIDSLVIYSRTVEFTVEDNQEERAEYLEEIDQAKDNFAVAYQRYSLLQENKSQEPNGATIMDDWNRFAAGSDNLIQLVQEGASEEAIKEERESLEQVQKELESTVDWVLDTELARNRALKSSVGNLEDSLFAMILIVLAGSVMVATGLGLLVSHRISEPLMQLKNSVTELARGNYETKITRVSNDEIGDLATHFERMKGELKEKDRMQNEFIMMASHELRTPIQPILGFTELALKEQIESQDALRKIRNEALRLKRLADDILDVTRIEGGKMTYNLENVNIKKLLKEVIRSFEFSIPSGISIVSDLPAGDEFVKGDKERLRQAFSNILNNAIKFTRAGEITVKCTKLADSGKLEIKISDKGTGIPPDVLPRLFGKFVTEDTGGRNKHGTGLGLFITKVIIEDHGGEIRADNNGQNAGATFTVVLPVSTETLNPQNFRSYTLSRSPYLSS